MSGSLGTGIVRLHPYVVGITGLTEIAAKREGIAHQVVHTLRGHHAGYYPGSRDLLIKLLFDPETGRVLGAQVADQEGVDKRIDVMATAIPGRMTIDNLAELDLAYAPSFGAAKDPVIITGMSAGNRKHALIDSVSSEALANWRENPEKPFVIDVRDSAEIAKTGILSGSRHIPLNQIRARIEEVPRHTPIVVYCRSGHRSYLASRIL